MLALRLRTTDYNNMKRLLLLFFVFSTTATLMAQDQHFTQFYASPLTLNPAMTGNFSGRYRVGMIYRDQWRGAFEQPFKTFSASADVRFDVPTQSRYKDAVAVGLLFFKDEVSGIDFVTNQLALSGAFHKSLGYEGRQSLSVGVQLGLVQRSVNYERLTFDDEFNSIDGYTLETRENLPANNFSFSDFNVGLNYSAQFGKKTVLNIGGAMHHVLQPQVTFYPLDSDAPITGNNKLFARYSGQISLEAPFAGNISIIPRVLFAKQGPHLELTAGANLRVPLNDYAGNALQFGVWARPVSNEDDSYSLDAIIGMVGIEWNNILFAVSYDVNLSDLTIYKQGQQSFEFSILYLGDFDNESILCPKF